ncbi:MAG TPA: hypothetical protein VF008_21960 [Niastella sp.]
MKRLLFCMTLILLITSACKKDGIVYYGDFRKSYQAWQDFKKANGDSYSFRVVTSSWAGYGTETTITVKQGKIIERSFVAKRYPDNGPMTIVQEWKEDESQLGTHDDGPVLLTMDEVYAKAQDEWLLKRDNAKTFFEAKNDGMISLCGYVENGCQDDCLRGIRIAYIKGL